MKSPGMVLERGTRVITHEKLGKTIGFMVAGQHIASRRPNAIGTVGGWVPGHGGDVYWVYHPDGSPAAVYAYTEMELLDEDEDVRNALKGLEANGLRETA